MEVQRYINQCGQVGVLYSPGYGAGWSSWVGGEEVEFALFDRELVRLAMSRATESEVRAYLESVFGPDGVFYTGGWDQIQIAWMEPGVKFRIEEYDGCESVDFGDLPHTA